MYFLVYCIFYRYQKDLPESLAGRNPRALTGDELAKIMRWKLKVMDWCIDV